MSWRERKFFFFVESGVGEPLKFEFERNFFWATQQKNVQSYKLAHLHIWQINIWNGIEPSSHRASVLSVQLRAWSFRLLLPFSDGLWGVSLQDGAFVANCMYCYIKRISNELPESNRAPDWTRGDEWKEKGKNFFGLNFVQIISSSRFDLTKFPALFLPSPKNLRFVFVSSPLPNTWNGLGWWKKKKWIPNPAGKG